MTSYDYEISFISYIFTTQIPNFFQSRHAESYHSKMLDILFNLKEIRIPKMQSIYDERQRKFDLEPLRDVLGMWDNL